MDRKFVKGLAAGLFLAFIASTFIVWLLVRDRKLNIPYGMNVMDEKMEVLQNYIDENYLGEYEMEDLYEGAYAGYVSGLGDRFSVYTSPQKNEEIKETPVDNVGIGVYIRLDEAKGYPVITELIKGSSAAKAGLVVDDMIKKINDEDIYGKALSEISGMIKGESGTEVKITIEREEEGKLEFTIMRDKLDVMSVQSAVLINDIGYIAVYSFTNRTASQFNAALSTLLDAEVKSLIIDLRDNGGGYVSTAVSLCGRILPKDKLVTYTIDKNGKREEFITDIEEELDLPIAILVNGGTASASEITSGCLRAYGKAVLVGEQTYGKGIVQTTYNMMDESSIKLTTAKYYTPDDQNIHGVGFTPDIEVKDDPATEDDEVLLAAMDYLLGEDK